ncbi:MAG: hypothetical protein H6721_21995 [Sandaracinus sp.]|nr:hypothetical protein [Sandaracinus sp.]
MAAGMKCGICGAPRTPAAGSCMYCGSAFADATTGGSGPAPGGIPHGVVEALDRGQLIEAIKIYRQAKRCSLKEAKDACDAIRHSRGRR